MEGNTLILYLFLSKNELIKTIEQLKSFIFDNRLFYPEFDKIESINIDELYDDWQKYFSSDYFYSKDFGFSYSLHIGSNYCIKGKKEEYKWIEISIGFKTFELAKDPNNDDYLMSNFEYSDKSKKIIKSLAEKLFLKFPAGYVLFLNEYQDIDIEQLFNSKDYNYPESDFEYAVLPLEKKSELFQTTGTTLIKNGYKTLCSHIFN